MTIWNPKYECMGDEEKRQLQGKRLAETVAHVYANVPFYKKKMDDLGILPGDIKSIDNLKDLPFTYKTDLREHYPYGLFAVPMDDVVRIHASSGTTGKRTVVGYTRDDIDVWAEVMARTISACGATKSDILQNAYGYGLSQEALGYIMVRKK